MGLTSVVVLNRVSCRARTLASQSRQEGEMWIGHSDALSGRGGS